jgi:acyl-coenzyme A thioesterase PaaI-like protein
MRELPHTRSCFVCGETNPAGLKLRMETDGRRVVTRWRPGPEHIGFQGTVHGGLLSTVLDELMVWACAVQTRRFAVCAELTVRFRKPVRPEREILVTAEFVGAQRQRVYEARAELLDEANQVLVWATGKYLPIPPRELDKFLADVVGDMTAWVVGEEPSGLENRSKA